MEKKELDELRADEPWETEHDNAPSLNEILADAIERAGGLPVIRIAKPDDPIKEIEL